MKILSLNNHIEVDDKHAETKFQEILKKVSESPDLEFLFLKGNNLTNLQLADLEGALSDCQSLRKVNLSYNYIDNDGVESLKKIIAKHPRLTDLSLDYNNISDNGLVNLSHNSNEAMKIKLKSLQISLAYNPILESGLVAASNYLSPSTTLSLLADGKIREKNADLAEQHRQKAIKEIEEPTTNSGFTPYQAFTQQKSTETEKKDEVLNQEQRALAEGLAAQSDEIYEKIILQARAIKQENVRLGSHSASVSLTGQS